MTDQLIKKLEQMDKRQRGIESMLIALHKSNKNFYWIEGFIIGSTESDNVQTGKPSTYVLLCGAGDYMQDPTCKVYPNQQKELLTFITDQLDDSHVEVQDSLS